VDKKSTVQRMTPDLAMKLRTEFVQGIEIESGERQYLPIVELATKYNVAQTTLFRLSQKENWRDQKEQFKVQLQEKMDEETAKQMAVESRKFDSKSVKVANQLMEIVHGKVYKNLKALELDSKTDNPSQILSLANTAVAAQRLAKLAFGESTDSININGSIQQTEAFTEVLELLDTVAEQRTKGNDKPIH
jgi:hypothetical protein|tara:strand:- start:2796 stop:3365 length:570 start_codon:yes stop_codon:yes gene_type:complete